jgi:hypothetical protein
VNVKCLKYKTYILPTGIVSENMELLGSLMQQIHVSTQSFGVWIPLAFGLVVGLVYVIASAARRSR